MKQVALKDLSKEIKGFSQATLAQQKKAVASGLAKSIAYLVKQSPVDTGLYAQSWNFDVANDHASIGNFAPYAPVIEFGARPFTPPLKPLLDWAKRVLKDPGQPPDYSPRVWALAKSVQKKIAEHGMAPKNILGNATSQILANIKEELDRG